MVRTLMSEYEIQLAVGKNGTAETGFEAVEAR
jgi:hypothetical protein